MSKQAFDQLFSLASGQDGCFTSRQAKEVGYSPQSQSYHVKTGDWMKMGRGIFRLKHFPGPRNLRVMSLYLWAADGTGKPVGVFSRETAFAMYPYSVWVPRKDDIIVPPGFRKRAMPPSEVRIHRQRLAPVDITIIDGLPVTTILRTLVDFLSDGFLEKHYLKDYLRVALHMEYLKHEDFFKAHLSIQEKDLLISFLERVKYERVGELKKRLSATA
jgi:predicted transcriptional regulator of viral defense system